MQPNPLTLQPHEAAAEYLRRRSARERFMPFVHYMKPNYDENWHHTVIGEALERFYKAVKEKKSPRLMIRTPPRGGKSELVSRKFPAWVLGKEPDWQIIGTSYNDSIASDMGGDAKDLVTSERYKDLFATRLKSDSTAKDNWRTTAGGVYKAAGVGGSATGYGANILTIDDPYKDSKDAWSPTVRKNIWDWLTTVALLRLMPGGGVLVMLTSWHDDGLDNKLLRTAQEAGEDWEVIDIPAIMEASYQGRHPQDPRAPGESYWASAWPLEELHKIRRRIGPNAWSALYQQRAVPAGGTIIKPEWIRTWLRMPEQFDEMILSWDLAFKGEVTSSRVVGHVWARRGGDFYLLHRMARVMEFKESLDEFLKMSNAWPRALIKLVEAKANGSALQSMLEHQVPGIFPVEVNDSKEGRLRAVSPVFASGNVYLPDPQVHPWAAEIIEELVRFPASEYNDDTDATSQGLGFWVVPGSGPARFVEWKL